MVFQRASDTRFIIEIAGAGDEFQLLRLEGTEAISQPFSFELEVVCEDPEVALATLVGQSAVVTLLDPDADGDTLPRFIHGLIVEAGLGEQAEHQTSYHLTLMPKLQLLAHRHNSRIFQQRSLVEILTQILDEAGLSADERRFELGRDYPAYNSPAYDYCVQYRESELDFFQRLLEDEGLFYYFEHRDDRHILVVSDTSLANTDLDGDPQLAYRAATQGRVSEPHVFKFGYRATLGTGRVELRSYDFRKPTFRLEGQASVADENSDQAIENYDHPGTFQAPDHGRQQARDRLLSLNSRCREGRGASDISRLTPGYACVLEDHPRDSLNRKYLLTRVEHQCAQPQVLEESGGTEGTSYSNTFECVPFIDEYRPARTISRPLMSGSQTAIVTGPAGEEIYTDEFGRIKVQFHWDREGQADQHSSAWIRVSQSAAGGAFGGCFLPRIGEEVVVDFEEGDPDRPIVIGRLYNGLNRPPYALPEHKTKSTLKSNSTPGGDGYNELRFEDKVGEEQVFIHAEKDQDQRIGHDSRQHIGNNEHSTVAGHDYSQIQGDEHRTVDGTSRSKIGQDEHQSIGGSRNTDIAAKELREAGMELSLASGQKIILDAGSELTLKAGGSLVKLDPSGVTIVGPVIKLNAGGAPGSGSSPQAEKPSLPAKADSGWSGFPTAAKAPEPEMQPLPMAVIAARANAFRMAAQQQAPLISQCQRQPDGSCPLTDCPCGRGATL
jgi:type VI secretion system secreted protein VgrG